MFTTAVTLKLAIVTVKSLPPATGAEVTLPPFQGTFAVIVELTVPEQPADGGEENEAALMFSAVPFALTEPSIVEDVHVPDPIDVDTEALPSRRACTLPVQEPLGVMVVAAEADGAAMNSVVAVTAVNAARVRICGI
jgi:hypothetical protein